MDGEKLPPFGEIKLIDRRDRLNPGVGNKNIQPAECIDRFCHAIRRLRFIGDVNGNAEGTLGAAKFGGDRLRAFLVEVGDHDFGAFACEQRRNSLADAAGRSGNDGDFVFKLRAVLQL